MPLVVALAVAAFHLRPAAGAKRDIWVMPALLMVMATGLSFYQIRTLPFASAISIPDPRRMDGEVRARSVARTANPLMRAVPCIRIPRGDPDHLSPDRIQGLDLLTYLSQGRIARARRRSRPRRW